MGICLDVESIVHTPRYPSLAPHTIYEAQWYAERWGLLALICKTFSWKKIPWDEPSTYHSAESYCCNKSKYDLLRTVACAAALQQPFTTPHSAWVVYHAAPAVQPYRHLIERNDSEYMALYLPMDLASPIAIPSTSAWDTFTVGSAVHLKQAADALVEINHQYGRERGASTVVDPRDDAVPHTWSDLEELRWTQCQAQSLNQFSVWVPPVTHTKCLTLGSRARWGAVAPAGATAPHRAEKSVGVPADWLT